MVTDGKMGKLDRVSGHELNEVVNRMFGNSTGGAGDGGLICSNYMPWEGQWVCKVKVSRGKENISLNGQARLEKQAVDKSRERNEKDVLQPKTRVFNKQRQDSGGADSCPGTPELPRKFQERPTGEDSESLLEYSHRPRMQRLGSIYSSAAGFDAGNDLARMKPRTPARAPPAPPST